VPSSLKISVRPPFLVLLKEDEGFFIKPVTFLRIPSSHQQTNHMQKVKPLGLFLLSAFFILAAAFTFLAHSTRQTPAPSCPALASCRQPETQSSGHEMLWDVLSRHIVSVVRVN
jgi:hypothetical protein